MSETIRMRRRGGRRAIAVSAIALVVSLCGAGPGLVREQVAAELTAAGFPDAQYVVEALSSDRAVLRDVHLPPDLVIDRVEIAFDPGTLLRDGRVTEIAITGAVWATSLDDVEHSALARLMASSGGEDTGVGGGTSIERVRIAGSRVELEGHAITIERAEIQPSEPSGALVVRSELGTHDVRVAPRRGADDGSLTLEARPRAGGLAFALDADRALTAVRWRVDGRAPRAWFQGRVFVPGTDPGISASGIARRAGDAQDWVVEDVAASVHLASASCDGVELTDLRAAVRGRGSLDAIAIDDLRISAARVRAGDLGAEDVVLAGALDLTLGEEVHAVERAPLALRASTVTIGSGADEMRLDGVALALEHRDGPIASAGSSGVRLAAQLRGDAPRARGVVAARAIRARGTIAVELCGDGCGVSGRIRAEAATLAHADSDVALTRPEVDLRLSTDARGRVRATGRGRAEHAAWRNVPVGPTAAHVRITRQELAIDAIGRATRDAPFALAARIGLDREGGSVHIGVPMSEVRESDPLHRVLAELIEMRIVGRAGGQVDADLGTLGVGTARIAVEGASLDSTIGSSAARGVHGEIALVRLDPAVSAVFAPVRFRELHVGDLVTTGPGTARVRFADDGQVEVEALTAVLGGGRVRLGPFRMDLDEPDTTLDVAVAGVDLSDVVTAVSSGRLTATGEIDGRVALRVRMGEKMRVVLGEGHLTARPPGRIRVVGEVPAPDPTRDPRRIAGTLGRRVMSALADFEYSRLSIDLVREGDATLARATVAGRGTRTPQEIELALNVHGLQPLLDQVLRLWPSTSNGSPE